MTENTATEKRNQRDNEDNNGGGGYDGVMMRSDVTATRSLEWMVL